MTVVLKFPLERVTRTSQTNTNDGDGKVLLFEGVRHVPGQKENRGLPIRDNG